MELLAPAGDLEKLKIAVDYGADAVYFGGEMFGLRAAAKISAETKFAKESSTLTTGQKGIFDRQHLCPQ